MSYFTILITSWIKRNNELQNLLRKQTFQIKEYGDELNHIAVRILQDWGEYSIGCNRNALLQHVDSQYVT